MGMRYRKPSDADGATKRSAAAIAAIERTMRTDSTVRMRRSTSAISCWVPRVMASGTGVGTAYPRPVIPRDVRRPGPEGSAGPDMR